LLKKFQIRGFEERGMRRTFLYAAITSDEGNKVDGTFSATCRIKKPPSGWKGAFSFLLKNRYYLLFAVV
jgi:hypothetical protein